MHACEQQSTLTVSLHVAFQPCEFFRGAALVKAAVGAANLSVTNSAFLDTNGTAPQAGVWLQPGVGVQRGGVATLDNVSLINVTLKNNRGGALSIQQMINAASNRVNVTAVHMRFVNTVVEGCNPDCPALQLDGQRVSTPFTGWSRWLSASLSLSPPVSQSLCDA